MASVVCCKGCGCKSRSTALSSKNTAEPPIKADCASAERLSALPWPKGWLSSAGRKASRTANKFTMLASESVSESTKLAKRLTEPLASQAQVFKPTSKMAVATEA